MNKRSNYFSILLIGFLFFHFGCKKEKDSNDNQALDTTPKACFELGQTNTRVGDTISFNNCSKHSTIFKWYFGDGDSSSEENPKHIYTKAGIYNSKLIVERDDLIDSIEKVLVLDYYPSEIIKIDYNLTFTSVDSVVNWDPFEWPEWYPTSRTVSTKIDIDGDSYDDLKFYHSHYYEWFSPHHNPYWRNIYIKSLYPDNVNFASYYCSCYYDYSLGDTIFSDVDYESGISIIFSWGGETDCYVHDDYIGFRISKNGSTNYGYIKFHVFSDDNPRVTINYVVFNKTPNTPIIIEDIEKVKYKE